MPAEPFSGEETYLCHRSKGLKDSLGIHLFSTLNPVVEILRTTQQLWKGGPQGSVFKVPIGNHGREDRSVARMVRRMKL